MLCVRATYVWLTRNENRWNRMRLNTISEQEPLKLIQNNLKFSIVLNLSLLPGTVLYEWLAVF